MNWLEKNHPGTPIAKLREGTPGEVWVTFDRIEQGYVQWSDWSFHRGDAFLFSVSKKAIGDAPSRELLQALLDTFEAGRRAGEFRGFREGQRCLQRDLRRTLGITTPADDADDMLQSVHNGVISRERAEEMFGRPVIVATDRMLDGAVVRIRTTEPLSGNPASADKGA